TEGAQPRASARRRTRRALPSVAPRRRDLSQQVSNSQTRHRIDELRRDFRERTEHERALAESWMRHREAGLVDDAIPIQNEIEIERPRRAGERPLAAALALDRLQRFEELARGQAGLADDRAVQERRLDADADGLGVVPARD